VATFEAYDRGGGGLVAAGLAYTSLLAILAGLLLVVSAIGFYVDDPEVRAGIVDWIGRAVPPLEPIAEAAFESVSQGAVPSSIVAIIGLLWGSTRLYAGMDYAFTRIFADGKPRNEIERTLRGIFLVLVVVALPLLMLVVGSLARWLLDLAPGLADIQGVARSLLTLSTPLGSIALFIVGTVLVYRFVPSVTPPIRALLPPALLVGTVLAVFAQLFTFIGPLLGGVAAIYGAFVTLFALLAWLSISFNMLLMGAALTRVRALALAQPAPAADPGTPPPGEGERRTG
jgi:YihY family inner membrane protein